MSNMRVPATLLDRQRQAEKKQQEVEREAERKRKHMGGPASVLSALKEHEKMDNEIFFFTDPRQQASLFGQCHAHRIHPCSQSYFNGGTVLVPILSY